MSIVRVAEVVDRLEELGRLNNTVIIFTSDNGYLWGEHGLWGKDKVYEESIRVPFIVVMPGVAPAHRRQSGATEPGHWTHGI